MLYYTNDILLEQYLLKEDIFSILDAITNKILISRKKTAQDIDVYSSSFKYTINSLRGFVEQFIGRAYYDPKQTKKLNEIVKGVNIIASMHRLPMANATTFPLIPSMPLISVYILPISIYRSLRAHVTVKFANNHAYINGYNNNLYVYYNSELPQIMDFDELTAILLHEVGHNIYALKRTKSIVFGLFLPQLVDKLKNKRKELFYTYAYLTIIAGVIVYFTTLYSRFVNEPAADTFVKSISPYYAKKLASALYKMQNQHLNDKAAALAKLARSMEIIIVKLIELIVRWLPILPVGKDKAMLDHPSTAARIAIMQDNPKVRGLAAKLDKLAGKFISKIWKE